MSRQFKKKHVSQIVRVISLASPIFCATAFPRITMICLRRVLVVEGGGHKLTYEGLEIQLFNSKTTKFSQERK